MDVNGNTSTSLSSKAAISFLLWLEGRIKSLHQLERDVWNLEILFWEAFSCFYICDQPCYQICAFAAVVWWQTLWKTGWKGKQKKQIMGYILDVFLTSWRFKITQIQRRFFHFTLPEPAYFILLCFSCFFFILTKQFSSNLTVLVPQGQGKTPMAQQVPYFLVLGTCSSQIQNLTDRSSREVFHSDHEFNLNDIL